MARFDADTNGSIIKFVPGYLQEANVAFGAKPPGTVYSLQFDEATNAGLITAYQANTTQFTMPGGTLTQTPPSGPSQVATVNPPSPFYDGFLRSAEILARLSGDQLAIAAAAFRANSFPV